MNHIGNHAFSDSRLPKDQDGGISCSHAHRLAQGLDHVRTAGNDFTLFKFRLLHFQHLVTVLILDRLLVLKFTL